MAVIYTVQDGRWTDGTTWNTGAPPTGLEDYVDIRHTVTLYNNSSSAITLWGKMVTIREGGSLIVDKRATGPITAAFEQLRLEAVLNDTRRVDLDGVRFSRITPSITALTVTYPDAYETPFFVMDKSNGEVIIADTGFVSVSSVLRDIKPEGCARAYAEKISNGVRYHTIVVKIKYTSLHCLRTLYRMAANPFQVLAVTPSCAIKGWIESVTPDPASVGAEYITVRVTITEGP